MGSITIDGVLQSCGSYLRCRECRLTLIPLRDLLATYSDDIPSSAVRCEECEELYTDSLCTCCNKVFEHRVDEPSQIKTLKCTKCRGWHKHT